MFLYSILFPSAKLLLLYKSNVKILTIYVEKIAAPMWERRFSVGMYGMVIAPS